MPSTYVLRSRANGGEVICGKVAKSSHSASPFPRTTIVSVYVWFYYNIQQPCSSRQDRGEPSGLLSIALLISKAVPVRVSQSWHEVQRSPRKCLLQRQRSMATSSGDREQIAMRHDVLLIRAIQIWSCWSHLRSSCPRLPLSLPLQ
jgi:hypothetical protein